MQDLEKVIERAFDNRAQGFDNRAEVEAAVQEALALLDAGKARRQGLSGSVAEERRRQRQGKWPDPGYGILGAER